MKTYCQISAARGPVECARVVYLVFQKLENILPGLQVIDFEEHNDFSNAFMSITAAVDNQIPENIIKEWQGTIQWVATKNQYRPNHKRKNWFITVQFFSELDLPVIDEKDIIYQTCRSGGAGGQHVNKVESTVIATHIPTGISVKCSIERSQFQNKKLAKELLLIKLAEIIDNEIEKDKKEKWLTKIQIERGNPIKKLKGEL